MCALYVAIMVAQASSPAVAIPDVLGSSVHFPRQHAGSFNESHVVFSKAGAHLVIDDIFAPTI